MKLSRLLIGFVPLLSAVAADPGLDQTLKALEARYNQAKTLQVLFREEYTPPGRPHRVEAGTLLLRKPGKMRWEYSTPAGKLFVSDGKFLWLYVPSENRAEKMKLQQSDDMRAPLAFLLGKLNFEKEFRNIAGAPDPLGTRITAEPKIESLPYSKVEFVVTRANEIRRVRVTGFDKSTLDFSFDQEQLNPTLNGKLFDFKTPPGAQLVEATQ